MGTTTDPGTRRGRASELLRTALLALGVSLVLLVFFSPEWVAFRAWERVPEVFWQVIPVRRGSHVALQVADPFLVIDDPLHKILRWRLLLPMVGHLLHLPATVVLALAHAGCVLVLGLLVDLGRRRGYAWGECALLAVVAGASAWFFTAMGWLGYYDSWLVLGLLAVAWVERPWLLWLACVLTPWVDERFVLGFPLALLVRLVARSEVTPVRELLRAKAREVGLAVLLVAGYVGLRLWLAGRSGSHSLAEYRQAVDAGVPLWRRGFGAWEGLRAGWIPVCSAVLVLLARGRTGAGVWLALGVGATTVVGLASNNDLSRSAALLLPVVPLGWELARTTAVWKRAHIAPLLAGLALFVPAHHVVSTFTLPVHSLWHELHSLRDPPPPYAPDEYLRQAQAAADQGDKERATGFAATALRLAPPEAPIRVQAAELLQRLKGRGR